MIKAVKIDSALESICNAIKNERKTNNFSQIVREALWDYAKKILPNFNQICIRQESQKE